MIDDLLTRLRRWGYDGYDVAHEAANEIERLKLELRNSKVECQMADDAVQDLQARLIEAMRRD